MNCGTCRHWSKLPRPADAPVDAPDMGACKFAPPCPVAVTLTVPPSLRNAQPQVVTQIVSQFPLTPPEETCGAHTPRTGH